MVKSAKRGIIAKEIGIEEKKLVNDVKGEEKRIVADVRQEEQKIAEEINEISLRKIVQYNLIFFIPVFISVYLCILLSKEVNEFLQLTPKTTFSLLLTLFMTLILIFIIPYIRKREKKAGFRMVVVGFLIVGIFMAVPSMLRGDFGLLLSHILFIAIFLLLTFIYAPEVLGISGDIKEWFKHHHQVIIVALFLVIVLFFVFGFAWVYYIIYNDHSIPKQFDLPEENPSFGTFLYYSVIVYTYGDINPVGVGAKFVFIFERVILLVMNVLFIAILLLFVSNLNILNKKK